MAPFNKLQIVPIICQVCENIHNDVEIYKYESCQC